MFWFGLLALAGFLGGTSCRASLDWGTYRPNLYFGTRTRAAQPFMTGLIYSDVRGGHAI